MKNLLGLLAFCFALVTTDGLVATPVGAQQPEILEFVGPTMGTRYSIKVFDPPEFEDDIRFEVDALLRRINDQMSTYLKNSEISRFNASESTDWVEVSPELAVVVQTAQDVAEKSGGAFDITVGPLVNAWSFGPDPRTRTVPAEETLKELLADVGYKKLEVRTDPPALKKSLAKLKIDLSGIAKGYAVDQVVQLLNDAGAENVFVEIGGEVRTSGDKDGTWWKVGIQMPDTTDGMELVAAHSMNVGAGDDQSMATSGDYRNYFEVDGTRYSHTIDPRTGRPIEHRLASVSVVTESCMVADAWATALNVLGPDALATAEQQSLDVLLISREPQQESGFLLQGTGPLARYGSDQSLVDANAEPENAGSGRMAVFLITTVAFAALLFLMAVGVMFGRRSISGSCGGLNNSPNEDGTVSCSLCSNPSDACKELRDKMQKEAAS